MNSLQSPTDRIPLSAISASTALAVYAPPTQLVGRRSALTSFAPPSLAQLAVKQERMAQLMAFECAARAVWLDLALSFMETKDGKSIARHVAGEAELTAGLLMTLMINASAWERRFGISRGTIADVAPAMRGEGLLHYPDSPKGAPLRATLCFPGDLTAEIWKVAAQIIGKKFELVEISNFSVKPDYLA